MGRRFGDPAMSSVHKRKDRTPSSLGFAHASLASRTQTRTPCDHTSRRPPRRDGRLPFPQEFQNGRTVATSLLVGPTRDRTLPARRTTQSVSRAATSPGVACLLQTDKPAAGIARAGYTREHECRCRPGRHQRRAYRQQRGPPRAPRTRRCGRRCARPAISRMQGSRVRPPLPAYRGTQPSSLLRADLREAWARRV